MRLDIPPQAKVGSYFRNGVGERCIILHINGDKTFDGENLNKKFKFFSVERKNFYTLESIGDCGSGGVFVSTQKETTSVCLYAYPNPPIVTGKQKRI